MPEYGPFETENEALATQAAAMAKAAFNARIASRQSAVGAGDAERLKILTDACEAADVTLGAYERRFLEWLAEWETGQVVALAGIIRRAAQPPEDTVTSWGVRYTLDTATGPARPHVQRYPDEAIARAAAAQVNALEVGETGVVVSHQITPWTEAPETARKDTDGR